MKWGPNDSPMCSLKGVKSSKCKKPNGKKKTWMTFAYGWGELHFHKYDHFSDIYSTSYYSSTPSSYSSKSSSSSTLIPQYFIIKAFYFKIRGASKVTLMFTGDISKTVSLIFLRQFGSFCLSSRYLDKLTSERRR